MKNTARTLSAVVLSTVALGAVAATPAQAVVPGAVVSPPKTICSTGPCAADPNPGVATNFRVINDSVPGHTDVWATAPTYTGTSTIYKVLVELTNLCNNVTASSGFTAGRPGAIPAGQSFDVHLATPYIKGCGYRVSAVVWNEGGYYSFTTAQGVM